MSGETEGTDISEETASYDQRKYLMTGKISKSLQRVAPRLTSATEKPTKTYPLGELFVLFQKHAGQSISTGSSLAHILSATNQISSHLADQVVEDCEVREKYKIRTAQIRAYQYPLITKGLAIYLFDRFLRNEKGSIENVFVQTHGDNDYELGQLALISLYEQDLGRISFNLQPKVARNRLVEIAEDMHGRYSFVDTTYWQVSSSQNWRALPTEVDAFARNISDRLSMHEGKPLFFKGRLPNAARIDDLMGATARPSDQYISELVAELHRLRNYVKDGALFQERASINIGVPRNTRTFQKVWKLFKSELTPEQIDQLPKRGAPKREKK